MKKPERRGKAIDLGRMRTWVTEFASFRHQVPEGRIRDWLAQFNDEHQDIAARLLDCVDFINNEQVRAAFRTILEALPGWSPAASRREGRWRFAPYTSSSGESGDTMISVFRHANNMASRRFNDLFIYRSDFLRERLGADDTVVLVDDMVGSGQQVCDSWDESFAELLAEVGSVYLIVVAACSNAVQRITDHTSIDLKPHFQLTDADNFFHTACKHFNGSEKRKMLEYCQFVDKKKPKGHGDSGLVVVFSHTIPNNSLPILGKSTDDWQPLFRRYD